MYSTIVVDRPAVLARQETNVQQRLDVRLDETPHIRFSLSKTRRTPVTSSARGPCLARQRHGRPVLDT
ncbi:hypothetical protein [Streptomyces niveus]|uniref:hypothetical protein n=1 Tax=Streptomyces niveus TaxID=193462 RepID=UPI003F4E327C